jgi:hypothetical protein
LPKNCGFGLGSFAAGRVCFMRRGALMAAGIQAGGARGRKAQNSPGKTRKAGFTPSRYRDERTPNNFFRRWQGEKRPPPRTPGVLRHPNSALPWNPAPPPQNSPAEGEALLCLRPRTPNDFSGGGRGKTPSATHPWSFTASPPWSFRLRENSPGEGEVELHLRSAQPSNPPQPP